MLVFPPKLIQRPVNKYAKQDIVSYVSSSTIRAKKGDVLEVFKIDGNIAYCKRGKVSFTTTLDNISDEYVAAEKPEISKPIKKRK